MTDYLLWIINMFFKRLLWRTFSIRVNNIIDRCSKQLNYNWLCHSSVDPCPSAVPCTQSACRNRARTSPTPELSSSAGERSTSGVPPQTSSKKSTWGCGQTSSAPQTTTGSTGRSQTPCCVQVLRKLHGTFSAFLIRVYYILRTSYLLTYMGVFGLSFVRFLRRSGATQTWIWHTGS